MRQQTVEPRTVLCAVCLATSVQTTAGDASSTPGNSLSAALVEVHAVASRLLILDHLELIRAQTEGLQDAVTELTHVSNNS